MPPVPTALTDLSATAASNSPSGSESVGSSLDDYLRGIQAVLRGNLAHKGADIASATTTDLGAVVGLFHDITGTTTITGFGTVGAGVWKVLQFDGALTLTHNATSLILPGGANITTAAGDVAIVVSEGSGNWRCVSYQKASGGPLPFSDADVVVVGSADKTKKIRFEVDGLTAGNTRVLTVPDADLTMVGTATTQTLTNKTITSPVLSGTATGSYTLGGTPTLTSDLGLAGGNIAVTTTTATAGAVHMQWMDANTRTCIAIFQGPDGTAYNGANTILGVRQTGGTGRSINAAGTVNASGADYAEYETKRDDCGVIAKGAVVGFDADGKLTDRWALAVTFGVKSTAPSYVGGDAWGRDLQGEELEAARQKVDRIAYAGKVPVNVYGATPGQWIDAAQDGEGIKGVPVNAQGPNTVGRVRRVLDDGRAEIAL